MSKRKVFRLYLRYSIWLTAFIVIVLIIFLGLSVYSVRERSIVELFSAQQVSVADHIAARMEEAVAECEEGVTGLAGLLGDLEAAPERKRQGAHALYEDLAGFAGAVITVDKNDTVTGGSPEEIVSKISGSAYLDPAMSRAVRGPGRSYTVEIAGVPAAEGGGRGRAIGVGAPVLDGQGGYAGAVIAVLLPELFLTRAMPADQTYMSDVWLVDESGTVVFHTNKDIRAEDLKDDPYFRMFAYDRKRYGELSLFREGRPEKSIIAYAPVRIGAAKWWIVLVTPYDRVLKPIRSASFNIILGAVGLIAVVIITAVSIARSDVKRARMKEELKRLRENEEWQSRLLREKMTIDGIIQGSPVPTFVLNKEHKVILWNRACTDLTGFSTEEMINTDRYYMPFYKEKRPFLADLIIDHNIGDFDAYYGEGQVIKSDTIEGAYEAVKHFKNMRGKDRHLHFLAAPIYDEKGEIVAAIETFLDVTKEVELTRSLREYAEILQNELDENIRLAREVEDLYNYLQSILDNLPDKVYELNRDGIINYVSRQIRDRGSKHDPKGRHFTEFVAPEHRAYAMEKWEDAKRGIFKPYELEVTRKDGRKKRLLVTPGPVKGTDRFVLVERDITEIRELQDQYYESQKLAAIGQLSAGIAHEVRNPLSSIKMSLQILEKRMQPEGNDLKRFRIAQREVEHLEKIVRDVLIYAKPLDPKKEPVDMRAVIEQALAMVEQAVLEKEITVEKNYPDDPNMIMADPGMIKQALINIFQNAIDAMERKGRLGISLKGDRGLLLVEVQDNGCGIDEHDRPHLFNPFFTRKNYGTGLGLTQVKKIVDQHGGDIEVISASGEGTRFILSFPRGKCAEENREATV